MASVPYKTIATEVHTEIHSGANLAAITTLAGEGAVVEVGALRITKAGVTVDVAEGEYLAIAEGTGIPSVITATALAAQWDEGEP